jgi:hypothetical protein
MATFCVGSRARCPQLRRGGRLRGIFLANDSGSRRCAIRIEPGSGTGLKMAALGDCKRHRHEGVALQVARDSHGMLAQHVRSPGKFGPRTPAAERELLKLFQVHPPLRGRIGHCRFELSVHGSTNDGVDKQHVCSRILGLFVAEHSSGCMRRVVILILVISDGADMGSATSLPRVAASNVKYIGHYIHDAPK